MPTSRLHLLVPTVALGLALTGCAGAEEPAGLPTGEDLGAAPPAAGDPAAGSCPQGDPDCTDESYDGQDVHRPVPLATDPDASPLLERGPTTGATGRTIVGAHLLDESTLQVAFEAGPCDRVEDVVVTASDAAVRLLVLVGRSTEAGDCAAVVQRWTAEVALDQPLGDRAVLDLAG